MNSEDGADMGVDAGRSLRTILGGAAQPSQKDKRSVAAMRTWLLNAPLPEDTDEEITEASYGEHARRLGGCFLRLIMSGTEPTDRALWDAYTKTWPQASTDFTGFMVGWAINAARRCHALPPAKNPAIMEIGD